MELGKIGIWTSQLDNRPGAEAQECVRELESLGYGALWIPEAVEREVISHATLLLAGSSHIAVATGIARIHARAPRSTALAQLLLAERFPGRFLLGLGVSHPVVVEGMLKQSYGPPLAVMGTYLDQVDVTLAAPHPNPPPDTPPRVLAALGPKMLAIAKNRAQGAHTFLAPVEHTAWARTVLGQGSLLIPAMKAVLHTDQQQAREIARRSVGEPQRLPAYRQNLLRAGFTEADVDPGLSDRLLDALVACGDIDTIVARAKEHLAAGADHVCVEILTGDERSVPSEAWRELAPALGDIHP